MPVEGQRVIAVLVGTGIFHHHPRLAAIPEVYTNLARLKEALMRQDVLGVAVEDIHVLVDRERSTLLRDLAEPSRKRKTPCSFITAATV